MVLCRMESGKTRGLVRKRFGTTCTTLKIRKSAPGSQSRPWGHGRGAGYIVKADELQFRDHKHEKPIRDIVFSPDGDLLAIGSLDEHRASVTLWDTSNPTNPQEAGLLHVVHQVADDKYRLAAGGTWVTAMDSEHELAHLALSSCARSAQEDNARALEDMPEILATASGDTVNFHSVSHLKDDKEK